MHIFCVRIEPYFLLCVFLSSIDFQIFYYSMLNFLFRLALSLAYVCFHTRVFVCEVGLLLIMKNIHFSNINNSSRRLRGRRRHFGLLCVSVKMLVFNSLHLIFSFFFLTFSLKTVLSSFSNSRKNIVNLQTIYTSGFEFVDWLLIFISFGCAVCLCEIVCVFSCHLSLDSFAFHVFVSVCSFGYVLYSLRLWVVPEILRPRGGKTGTECL